MAVILLVRHAQASFGSADYDVLSDRGHVQSRLLGQRLGHLPRLDRLVHGTMRRQEHTAELALDAAARDLPRVRDARWDEYDHEDVLAGMLSSPKAKLAALARVATSGDPRRGFQQALDRALTRWIDGHHDDDYRESYRAFTERVGEAFGELVDRTDGSETVAVITSGGVLGAVCADLLGLDPAGWARINRVFVNTGIVKVVVGRSGTTLVTVNDHAHLETADPDLLTYR